MREYFLILIGSCLVSAFASMLAPEGEGGGLSRWLNFASALCAVSVIVAPLLGFVGELYSGGIDIFGELSSEYGEVGAFEEIYCQTLTKESLSLAEDRIEELLCKDLSIDKEEVSASIILEYAEGEPTPKCVRIYLSGKAIFANAREISEKVGSLLLCECEIIYT